MTAGLTEIGNESNLLGGRSVSAWMTSCLVCLSGGTGDGNSGKSDLVPDLVSLKRLTFFVQYSEGMYRNYHVTKTGSLVPTESSVK